MRVQTQATMETWDILEVMLTFFFLSEKKKGFLRYVNVSAPLEKYTNVYMDYMRD